MRLTSDDLRELYREHTVPQANEQGDCLLPEMFLRAVASDLSRTERAAMADHLMACSNCADHYRAARLLKPWTEQVVTPQSAWPVIEEVKTSNRGFGQRLAALIFPARVSYAIVAAMLIISFSLAAWVASLRQEKKILAARLSEQLAETDRAIAAATGSVEQAGRQIKEAARRDEEYKNQIAELRRGSAAAADMRRELADLSRPQADVVIEDLDPRDSLRGDPVNSARTLTLPSQTSQLTLILNTTGQTSHAQYVLEMHNASGGLIWRKDGLRKSAENTFNISLQARRLPAGQYRFKLYGRGGGRTQLVEDYAIRIQYK